MESRDECIARIVRLKAARGAVILAHNYQRGEVQDIADFTGDSLELSRRAAATDARVIVFCGVYFMAESARILNPNKTVLLPEREAGCPLAEMLDAAQLRDWKAAHPGRPVVTYINSSAAVKAESDICCTSSNAASVVESLDAQEILFGPDMNLGAWVQAHTRKRLIVWNGYCATHAWVRPEEILDAKRAHPNAVVVAHPECGPKITALADRVCSTSGMLAFVRSSPAEEFIIVTEAGMLHRLSRDNPGTRFHLGSPRLFCPNMKRTTLASVAESLERMQHEIRVEEGIRLRAARALERMLEVRA
ncbi:MAG: quinolinate synthase NadA [Candidatus Aureabacteria bacterium]|nr:quinolinate synthase NadA [Candidatus Auribacterota bacterium]NLW95108.1 quinolinate synthase NadA [Chlamydiota bacterium]HOE26228.1 quinolinate synthase NadA [bacterium]HQM53202.1 quinolinate synthase NadA [bacterium]